MTLLETLGALIVGLLVVGGSVYGLNAAFGKNNIASTEQDLVLLRMNTQQFFFGTNYNNLTNDAAIKAGLVPKSLIKGDSLKNFWGGDVTLSSNAANGTFTIQLGNIPQEACIQLVRFQPESWDSVSVNGSVIDPTDVTGISDACGQNTNTVAFTAR